MEQPNPRLPFAHCAACPIYTPPKLRGDPCVEGSGPDVCDVVFVGEAPGATEIVRRKPFVGESGDILQRALRAAGIARPAIYVANAVACGSRRQGRNQRPSMAAVRACQHRLLDEVRRRRPKVVVLMGNTALRAFGIEENVSSCRGRERWLSEADLQIAALKGYRKQDIATNPVLRAWARGHEDEYLRRPRRGELHPDVPEGLPDFLDWRDGGVYVLPTYHPASCLYTPDLYIDIARDIAGIADLLKQPPAQQRVLPPVQVHLAKTVQQALDWIAVLEQQPLLACDIESRSKDLLLQPGTLLTLAYAWFDGDEVQALVLPAYEGALSDVHESWQSVQTAAVAQDAAVHTALQRLHERRDVRFTWWNGKFDRKWYWQQLGIEVRIDEDAMLLHYALDERRGTHGLKMRASDDLGADDYESEITRYTGSGSALDYGRIPLDKLVAYTADDVGMTLRLTVRYRQELVCYPDVLWAYRHILLPASAMLADTELAGFAVDTQALRTLEREYVNSDAAQGSLGVLVQHELTMQRALGPGGVRFNPASYEQSVQVLYGDAVRQAHDLTARTATGLPTLLLPVLLNEQGTPGTGSELCDKLLQDSTLTTAQREFLTALRLYRVDSQLYRTYIKTLPRVVAADGRVRTNFNLHTTRTGRLSSSDPTNLQNIPDRRVEGRRIKNAFVAGAWDGRVTSLVSVDLSQAEFRVAAFLSRDPTMLSIYREGRDFHHEVGVRILGSDARARELRPFIKTYNFACVPLDTQALTRAGWKLHSQIQIGDDVLGFDRDANSLRWTPVLEVLHYDDAPLTRLWNEYYSSISTPDHRWCGVRRHNTSREGRPVHVFEPRFIATADVRSDDTIILSAPALTEQLLPISAVEAAIIGWLVTDGSVRRGVYVGAPAQAGGRKVAFEAHIFQRKARGVTILRSLLQDIPHHEYQWASGGGTVVFRLAPSYARGVWHRASLDTLSLEQFVLQLGTVERESFLTAALEAEGWKLDTPHPCFSQNAGLTLDALRLAAFLCGYFPRTSGHNRIYRGHVNHQVSLGLSSITGQRIRRQDVGTGPVWCVRTALESWVIRQGDQIMLTGNSLYGAEDAMLTVLLNDTAIEEEARLQRETGQRVALKRWRFDEVVQLRFEFWTQFSTFAAWAKEQQQLAVKQGWVASHFGRRRRWHLITTGNVREVQKEAVNHPVQSTASDIMLLAAIELHGNYRTRTPPIARIIASVHDDIVQEVVIGYEQEVAQQAVAALEAIPRRYHIDVPFVAEAKVGTRWGSLQMVEVLHATS